MVLQAGMNVPIWGDAGTNEVVTVEFAGQKKQAVADAQGKWRLCFDPLPVCCEPRTFTLTSSLNGQAIVLTNVLVGEVWLGSGQSNMQGPASHYTNRDERLSLNVEAGPYAQIRLCVPGRPWMESSPAKLRSFSAQLFSFGLELQRKLQTPVGLLLGAHSGSPSGQWISPSVLNEDPACREEVQQHAARLKGVAGKAPPPGKGKPEGGVELMGVHYRNKIEPFIPYAIRGVLWDQGESGTAVPGVSQYALMGALIRGWRKAWGFDFDFLYVQKPSGGGCAWDETDPVTRGAQPLAALPASVPAEWQYRDDYLRMMAYPRAFMVTTSDLDSGVHPANKSGYGARGARVALGAVYGKPREYYGPLYRSHRVEEGKIVIEFNHVGQGLMFRGGSLPGGSVMGQLQGFAIAGTDRKYMWADATIEGETVVLSSARVPHPVAACYAWASVHPWANLFNKDGLPAMPFRTEPPRKAR
jgi:sialate O-acetylesterase